MSVLQTAARNPAPITNVWTKASGGNWSDASAWSAGLPGPMHWLAVTNANPKTVEINANTAQNFPESLSVLNLLVENTNTVLLNHVGATLRINDSTNTWNGLQLRSGGTVVNLDSDVKIVTGGLFMDRGNFFQSGGVVEAGGMGLYAGGIYRLTNGTFRVGDVRMDAGGAFEQLGGRVETQTGVMLSGMAYFKLSGGELNDTGESFVIGEFSTFTQEGGTFRTKALVVAAQDGSVGFFMDGGELYAGKLSVSAGIRDDGVFEQNGGLVVVTNEISLIGGAYHYPWDGVPGRYTVASNAVLAAGSLVCDQNWGVCEFENSGQASFSGNIEFNGRKDYVGQITISDGTLSCSNLLSDGTIMNIVQTGGALVVSNKFLISGYYPGTYGGYNAHPAIYDFRDGRVSADQIELTADWKIGSSTRAGRITNAGEIVFSGGLRVGDAQETLGRVILSGDSAIDLGDGNAKIAFAASSRQTWTASAMLVITNWNGSASGGGSDQVKFGNSSSGITAQQLSQIHFVNPNGFPGGEYAAAILDTGEIVPMIPPQMSVSSNSGSLVINWSNGGTLQSSVNVEGPYQDVPSASPPYVVDASAGTQLFLRLRP